MLLTRNFRCLTGLARNALLSNAGCVAVTPTAGFKSDLKIKWVRPQKIASWKPEKSCDGGLEHNIKPTDLANFYDRSKELEDADELVKRMFSLEFTPRKAIEAKRREQTLALVKRHGCDRGSMEVRLAAMTSEILNMQEYLKEHPRNTKAIVFLTELIAKRKKFLGKLRRWDYKRFEWILEKMNLVYKPHPEKYVRIMRKLSMRRLTRTHCYNLKQEKLKAYERQLAAEKQVFLLEKAQKLAFIRSEEIACGKEPTVTEEDIEEAKRIAEQINTKSGNPDENGPDNRKTRIAAA